MVILFNRLPRRTRNDDGFPFARLKALGFIFRPQPVDDRVTHWVTAPAGWTLRDCGVPHTLSVIDAEGQERGQIFRRVWGPSHFEMWSDFARL